MFRARLRKVALKRALDSTLYRGVASGAAAVVAASSIERDDVAAAGVVPQSTRIHVRGNGFPEPFEAPGRRARAELGIPDGAPIVLYVGRIAAGQGDRAPRRGAAGAAGGAPRARRAGRPSRRRRTGSAATACHVVGPTDGPPLALYRLADVFVLPSAGESFGMVAAEAAAAGTPVVVTDRCGIADFFRDGEALVVPDERTAILDAVRERARRPGSSRAARGRAAWTAARRSSWDAVTDRQEELYRLAVASRTPRRAGCRRTGRSQTPATSSRERAPMRRAKVRIGGERGERVGSRLDVAGRDEQAVLAVAEQVACGADAVGEDERQPARGGLVHDDAPGLVRREEREDVAGNVRLERRTRAAGRR